ncbi:MAG: hypothetical protein GY906_37875 [bacterium]|nr:hypothetical protein [bacterium]
MKSINASPRAGFSGAGFFLLCILACGGPSTPKIPVGDHAVASFSGGYVLRSEFDRFPTASLDKTQAEATAGSSDWRLRIVDEIAIRKLLAAKAAESDPDLQFAIFQARTKILRDAAYRMFSLDQVEVNDAGLRLLYDSHPEDFRDAEKLRLQQIYIRAEAAELTLMEREAARQHLESIRQEVLNGADFTAMARQHSDSATAASGGWILLKKDAKAHPQIVEEVWDLDNEAVSEVVASAVGFHLFKLKERIAPIERAFENVREFVHKRAVTEAQSQNEHDFIDQVGQCYGLIKDYETLESPFVDETTPLAYFNDELITFGDLLSYLPEPAIEQLYNLFLPNVEANLDRAVLEKLLLREAERLEFDSEPALAAAIRETEEEIKAAHVQQQLLEAKVNAIEEAELYGFYWQNQQRYKTLRKTDLSVIFLKNEGEPLFQTLKRGEALADLVRAGESFHILARENSVHYSAAQDGLMENLSDREIASKLQSSAKFRRMLKNLETGEIGVMVAECYDARKLRYVQTGVIVVRKDRVYESRQGSFELLEEFVRSNYLRRNYTDISAEVRREVLEDGNLTINFDALPPL